MSRGCCRHGLAGAWVLALVLGACSSKAPGKATAPPPGEAAGGGAGFDEAAPAEEDAGMPAAPGDELQALDARVDTAWLELETLDDEREKAAAAEPGAAAARCERIRGLADEICTLSNRMCTLATEHPGQARYVDACARSEKTCSRARQAAERCPAA